MDSCGAIVCLSLVARAAQSGGNWVGKLPIGKQEDGFSCGMLVDNAHQHFVDPSISLAAPGEYVEARLEIFNKACARILEQASQSLFLEIERGIARAGDEDSDDAEPSTATTSSNESESDDDDAPVLLRRIAQQTKFTFNSPLSSPAVDSPHVPSLTTGSRKRAAGHPDAPTPTATPERCRIYKRCSNHPPGMLPQLLFSPVSPLQARTNNADRVPATGRRGGGADEYVWGPEDDAEMPPETQLSPQSSADDFSLLEPPTTDNDASSIPNIATDNDTDLPALLSESERSVPESEDNDDLPGLRTVCCSDGSDIESDSDAAIARSPHNGPVSSAPAGRSRKTPSPPPPAVPSVDQKIMTYWTIETVEERALRLERDARRFMEDREEKLMREANDRRQKRKRVDLLDHDETPAPYPALPELSRPRRQFKEDGNKKNKPCGRKQKLKNKKRDAKTTNWFHPMLWSQIQLAAGRAGKPWKPRAILKQLQKSNSKDFHRLTEQVIGRWMDRDENNKRVSKWKDSVLENVAHRGNAPGGHNTRCGVLDPYPEIRKNINEQLTSLRSAGVVLTLLSIRAIMLGHIEHGAPELFHQTPR
ncbi:hypothetical protein B0H14DRAFT_3605365 [Mycena olivaceomarginata]|nr:hypothetical protein B0H14DRAFT_3605365 [Mycena olivaceomarginata]